MSGNLESERGSNAGTLGCTGAGKMYPMDLAVAPQKITIVKSAAAPGSVCTTAAGDGKLQLAGSQGKAHLLSHAAAISLMRPAPQIISQGVASQPQMIVSGTSLMPSGTQVISQSSQIITQSQIIGPSGQLLTPQSQLIGTPTQLIGPQAQIISQGTQLINQGTQMIGQASQLMSGGGQSSGAQVLSVGTSLVGGASVVVSSGTALRSLPSSMRVLPPTSHHNVRPVVSSVTVTPIPLAASKLSATPAPVGVSSHVPRGPAAGASLAVPRATVRPAIPHTVSALGGWSARGSLRGPALVYSARAALRGPVAAPALSPAPLSHSVHSQTPPATTLAGSGVISPAPRIGLPRVPPRAPPPRSPAPHAPRAPAALAPAPRPLPVLQRNYQPAKVVAVGARSALPVSGAARSALYYEVTRSAAPAPAPHASQYTYTHSALPVHSLPAVSMSVVAPEARLAPATSPAPAAPLAATSSAALARPSILRKRDVDGSPSKNAAVTASPFGSSVEESTGPVWGGGRGGGGGGGSTTESAASSPAPDDEPPSPPRADPSSPPPLPPATAAAAQHPPPPPPPPPLQHDISPRKKPRKQMLSSEVRACEPPPEEPPPSPPPIVHPPPRRSMLGAGWTCGWRPNAQHYTRPSDVRRREPRPPHVLELANQKHVLTKANGWKVHHLTAQMDDIVELESSSCDQLSVMLRSLDTEDLPELDCIKELIKGNMQRSRIVCEGMEEARADMLRVFTHRPLVADILARQADKRCFRKHRPSHSQN